MKVCFKLIGSIWCSSLFHIKIWYIMIITCITTQWCLGCDWIFQFVPYTPHCNHPDCIHLLMGTHLLCLESIRHYGFQFGAKGFEHLFTSMVLISPFFLRNSLKIWPTMIFFPTNFHHLHSLMHFVLLWINDITPLQQVCGCILNLAFKPLQKPLRILKFHVLQKTI